MFTIWLIVLHFIILFVFLGRQAVFRFSAVITHRSSTLPPHRTDATKISVTSDNCSRSKATEFILLIFESKNKPPKSMRKHMNFTYGDYPTVQFCDGKKKKKKQKNIDQDKSTNILAPTYYRIYLEKKNYAVSCLMISDDWSVAYHHRFAGDCGLSQTVAVNKSAAPS